MRDIPKNRLITIPKIHPEGDIIKWRNAAFRKILDLCKVKKIGNDEVFWVDYCNVVRMDRTVTEYDCKKPFTVKEMKDIIKNLDKK